MGSGELCAERFVPQYADVDGKDAQRDNRGQQEYGAIVKIGDQRTTEQRPPHHAEADRSEVGTEALALSALR
ncbi:hypothetical protein AC480_04025 [miscellaneous Crenarchaeota group archaeon SMTZ1-55]|nr:MAG: hypothetical protein AC480_04025 [miscellaneous Crenarchaeota group archaeon SMTZ1-55]